MGRVGRPGFAAVLVAAVLVAGCTDDESSPETADAVLAPDGCAGDDWVTVDLGPLRITTPADLVDQGAEGIDSLIGRYEGDGLRLRFDWGSDAPDGTRFSADRRLVTVDDVRGFMASAPPTLAFHAVIDDDTAFDLELVWSDPARADDADCILRSIEFAR